MRNRPNSRTLREVMLHDDLLPSQKCPLYDIWGASMEVVLAGECWHRGCEEGSASEGTRLFRRLFMDKDGCEWAVCAEEASCWYLYGCREWSSRIRRQSDLSDLLASKCQFRPLQGSPVAIVQVVQCAGKEVTDDLPLQIGDGQDVPECEVTLAKP
jgi:hypothetical protein